MKSLMLLGALVGFAIGARFSLIQGTSWPTLLVRATIAMYLAGMLARWWGNVWMRSLQQSWKEQAAQRHAPRLPATAAAKKP
jgi:uncharacterized membrane protein